MMAVIVIEVIGKIVLVILGVAALGMLCLLGISAMVARNYVKKCELKPVDMQYINLDGSPRPQGPEDHEDRAA